jgi:hypothetical protein
MVYTANLLERAKWTQPDITLIEIPYDYNYNMDSKNRRDWSGSQSQQWTSKQRNPQKTKFPYGLSFIKDSRWKSTDTSGGKWYFEDELIFATPADKHNNNIWMTGWTGGLILMTKYTAREMGLSDSDVLKNYRSDQAVQKNADKYGYEAPHFFFNYRVDGSIESIYTPPPPPPPLIKYIEVPVSAPPPDKPVIEPAPEPVFEVSKPEPVEEERVVTVAKTDNTNMILLAIVGVGILIAIIFTLRGRQNG